MAGLKEIAKEIFSKNNLKYGGSDIKAMALAVVESAHRHAGTNIKIPVMSEDFWGVCKGTEYESSAVAAIAVAYICGTGVYPYMPSKVLEHLNSKPTKSGSKLDAGSIFKGTSLSGGSTAINITELYMDALAHVRTMYNELEYVNITDFNSKVLAIKNADVLITALTDIDNVFSTFGDATDNEVGAVKELSNSVIASIKVFDGLVADPKSILTEVALTEFMSKADYYTQQLDVFGLFELYDGVGDVDALMSSLSTQPKADGTSLSNDSTCLPCFDTESIFHELLLKL
jgi:hypothetical protein